MTVRQVVAALTIEHKRHPDAPAFKLKSIEAGRGIAATLVVLYHASAAIFPAAKYWHQQVFSGIFGFGYAGVEFFFVLSGFIIAFAHHSDIGTPSRLANFVRRRFNRIYPSYWIVLAAVVIMATSGIGPPLPPLSDIISSFVLAGLDYSKAILGVSWTLFHEIGFYIVFGLAIWRPWAGAVFGVVAIAAAAAHIAGLVVPLPFYWQAPVNLLFPIGIIAWWVSRTPWRGGWLAVGGTMAFIATGIDVIYLHRLTETTTQLLFGLAAGVGIAGIVAHERRGTLAVPRLLIALGGASYSIYLVHFIVLSALAQFIVREG